MQVLKDIDDCRRAVLEARKTGGVVGLVPTMGALHEGHLSLVRAAESRCDFTAVTIFVNPTQFGEGEDFDAYPRRLEADLAVCRSAGVDLVFTPTAAAMYPPGVSTRVHVSGLTEGLCGADRPGHFDGVATVVAKLFNILPAQLAFFGEKDYQQLLVIRRMARDLNIPTEIVGCPIVREADGLAMSSRNARLSPAERRQAVSLSRSLFAARDRIASGSRDVGAVISEICIEILRAGRTDIQYVDIVDATTLESLEVIDRPARICLAVRIGGCRLIDNVAVDSPPAAT